MRVKGSAMTVRGFAKKPVPYMPGMGWRIMDVIDPENEYEKFLEDIEKQDYIEFLKNYLHCGKDDLV